MLMKTVLSYHHACLMTKPGEKATAKIPESFVHFLVPLCAVATRGSSSSSSSHGSGAVAAAAPNLKIESQIEGLVEMFEGALEAGLEGLVDPEELGDGGGGDAGSVVATRGKKASKAPKPARVAEPPKSEGAGGECVGSSADKEVPAWVDKAHGVLIPGLQELVDHVARVHLGLAVAPPVARSSEGGASEQKKDDGDGVHAVADAHGENSSPGGEAEASGVADEKARAGGNDDQQQRAQQSGGEGIAQPPSSPRRKSSASRRASLSSRRRKGSSTAANAEDKSAGDPTATGPDGASDGGGGEREETGETDSTSVGRRGSSGTSAGSSAVPLASVSKSQARAALWALLKPLVAAGLVGHLGADACLFAWDQAVIGGFGVMLPRVAAMVLAAAADEIRACLTFAVMSEALLSHARVVPVREEI